MNLYDVLGIAPDDPGLKIKARFRLLARTTHPDINKGNASSEFIRYAEAYKVLSDPKRRHTYNVEQGIDVQPRPLKPGYDLHQRLTLSSSDALAGGTFTLSFKRYEPCPRCWLGGCSRCGGYGLFLQEMSVNVRVPASTKHSITVFVADAGGVSEPGGQRGHLLVYISIMA